MFHSSQQRLHGGVTWIMNAGVGGGNSAAAAAEMGCPGTRQNCVALNFSK